MVLITATILLGHQPFSISKEAKATVFEQYSDRARVVVFIARRRSGKRGRPAIDIDHLIEAIIFEDQGKLADALDESGGVLYPNFEPKPHFFHTERAAELLLEIQQRSPCQESIPDTVDMPLSDGVKRTFAAATTLTAELNHKQVEPLHLLAAALSEPSNAAKLVTEAGITKDEVLMALKTKKNDG